MVDTNSTLLCTPFYVWVPRTCTHYSRERYTDTSNKEYWSFDLKYWTIISCHGKILRLRSLETRYYISMTTVTCIAKRKINTGGKVYPSCLQHFDKSVKIFFCLYCSESHTSPYQKPLLGDMVELWRQMRQFNLGTIGVSLFPDTVGKATTHSYHHSYFNILTDEEIFKCISYGTNQYTARYCSLFEV